jgi:hypothetical protein
MKDEDEDEDELPGYGEGEFICLDDGRCYIRKFEVIGLKWERASKPYLNDKFEVVWQLRLFFSDCPSMIVPEHEAADVMRSFGLPEDPPNYGSE